MMDDPDIQHDTRAEDWAAEQREEFLKRTIPVTPREAEAAALALEFMADDLVPAGFAALYGVIDVATQDVMRQMRQRAADIRSTNCLGGE